MLREGAFLSDIESVVLSYFIVDGHYKQEFRSFEQYQKMIDRGIPILSSIILNQGTKNVSGHAVLIIGYNKSM